MRNQRILPNKQSDDLSLTLEGKDCIIAIKGRKKQEIDSLRGGKEFNNQGEDKYCTIEERKHMLSEATLWEEMYMALIFKEIHFQGEKRRVVTRK